MNASTATGPVSWSSVTIGSGLLRDKCILRSYMYEGKTSRKISVFFVLMVKIIELELSVISGIIVSFLLHSNVYEDALSKHLFKCNASKVVIPVSLFLLTLSFCICVDGTVKPAYTGHLGASIFWPLCVQCRTV